VVEGGGDDLAADRPAQVGDLFWTLADEHHHHLDLRVAVRDRGRDDLQDHRLAGLGRGDDEAAGTLADRRDQIDDARRRRGTAVLQAQTLLRVQGGQVGEVRPAPGLVGRHAVDGVHLDQRADLAAALVGPRGPLDQVALSEPVLLDLPGGDVHVGRAAPVAGSPDEGAFCGYLDDAGHRQAGRRFLPRWS
jgi:hypothetical protein